MRVRIYSCAYCGGPIDPENPEAHILNCAKHPARRYLDALNGLMKAASSAAEKARGTGAPEIAIALSRAVAEANHRAFD